mgnify:FL=1|tara:strand:- start:978 stop:1382 length:405 start_codon:yes stop_codon:yes gene_type:complete
MNKIIIPNEIFINIIEPYSRKPQSKFLLDDIKSFYSTLEQVKTLYSNYIQKKYRNFIDLGYQGFQYSFYNELLKGLHIICGTNVMDYYSYQLLELQTRYCRQFWASCGHEERIEIIIALTTLFTRYSRRPGDPI